MKGTAMNPNQTDLYDVYMVLVSGEDIWWQGLATDGGDAVSKAFDYARDDYKQEVKSYEVRLSEANNGA
jgi:hypothetical protein